MRFHGHNGPDSQTVLDIFYNGSYGNCLQHIRRIEGLFEHDHNVCLLDTMGGH